MKRRRLLAALATGSIAVPGCLSESDGTGDGSPTATPSQTPTETVPDRRGEETPTGTPGTDGETPTATDGEFVTEAFAVPELAAPNSPDSFGVYGERDEQFVVALLNGAAAAWPAVGEIELVAGGESYDAQDSVSYGAWGLFDYHAAYSPEDGGDGWVVFQMPKPLEVDDATVSWPDGEYALAEAILSDLARPPTDFAVESFEAPATASMGETITLSLTVENTGDTDGTFVGAVNRNFPAYTPVASIRLPVAAGETATWEQQVTTGDSGYGGAGGELRFWLYWRGDGEEGVTVDVGTETAAGTETQEPTTDSLEKTRTADDRETRTETPETATGTPSATPTPLDE
ncbi:hypothetical protein [Halosimplex sp. J119]